MEVDTKSDNEDQSVVDSPDGASKKRKVSSSPISGEKKSSGNKRVKGIDDQADESGEEDGEISDDGSADGDDDGENYVYNDFLVRDDHNSDSDEQDASDGGKVETKLPKKRDLNKLKRQKGKVQLDEEDLLLVEENARNEARKDGKAASKAIKKYDDGEIAPLEGRKRSNTHGSEGDDGEEAEEESPAAATANRDNRRPRGYYDDDDEGSDMGGFIADEESDDGEADGENKPRRQSAVVDQDRTTLHRRTGRREGATYDQMRDAHDIFGADYGDGDFEDSDLEASDADSEGEDGGGEGPKDGDFIDGVGESVKHSRKDMKKIAKLRNRYERSQLVSTFCTERDDVLRRVDRPERLQEVLVGRDMPDEAERALEARWMAGKLAAKMVADDHLHRSRDTVPLVANPVAAHHSDLYFLQSNEEKEQRLREELEEPILHVLRFLQLEQWEVPFIWTNRRDYLHPLMTREHLWTLHHLEVGWDSVVASKMRLSDEVTAIQDASQVADEGNSAQGDAAHLAQLQSKIRRLTAGLEALGSDVRLAESEEKHAMDIVDDKDEPTAEDRVRVTAASADLEALQERYKTSSVELQELKVEEAQQLARLQRRSKFRPSAAKECMRLFPVERYLSIVRDTTDDTELRDVLRFFRLLAQNAEVGGGGGAEAEGEEDVTQLDENGETQASAVRKPVHTKVALRRRKDEYGRYKDLPAIRRLVQAMAVPAAQLGDALRHGFKVEPPATPQEPCDLFARLLVDSGSAGPFKSEVHLLRAAKMVMATELSLEPSVRGAARALFRRLATVSTRPTAKGLGVVTPFSEYFGLHYLTHKPLKDFYQGTARTMFIRLVEAEKLGLITVSIDVPQSSVRSEVKDADGKIDYETRYANDYSDFTSGELRLMQQLMPTQQVSEDMFPESRLTWDGLRLETLQFCVEQLLCPGLAAEFRRDLIRIGKEAIVQEASANFADMLRVGPYVPPYQDSREYVKDLLKACPNRPFYGSVASIYISTGRDEPLCMAFVNKDGVLRAHDLVPSQAMNQKNDRIRKFLVENRPDLVVLNSSGGQATRATFNLVEKNLMREVEEECRRRDAARRDGRIDGLAYADDDDEVVPYKAQIMVLKDELAKIFMNSDRRKKLFPELQPAEAAAVCLARYAQEPLAEYCSAWNSASSQEVFGYELLFLAVHPHKGLLKGAQQSLLDALECRLVDAVCDVGVDVNKAATYDHLAPLLAFVGGLGLRKADALRQNIRKGAKAITSRNDLLLRKLLGSCVWTNAAGFLRICDGVLDPLDNTRIHPECYTTHDFATKICADALEVVHSNSDYVGNVEKLMLQTRRVLEKRMEKHRTWLDLWDRGVRPIQGVTEYNEMVRTTDGKEHPLGVELGDILSQLELDDYAVELEESGQGKRRLLFEQIKEELRFPCLDLRLPLAPLSAEETFCLLTGETDQSLHVGLRVGGTITEVSDDSFTTDMGDTRRRVRATVQTDAGLRGFIGMYDMSDERLNVESTDFSSYVQVGRHVDAVVVGVKKDRMQLDLSIKKSLLDKPEAWWMEQRNELKQMQDWWAQRAGGKPPSTRFDPYFSEREALAASAAEEASQKKNSETISQQLTAASLSGAGTRTGGSGETGGGGRSMMRVVHHPLFANLDFKAAEERMRLEGKGAGEVLVRPSSKGPNFLTITWAFQDNWYKHISVEERGKRAGDLGLGSQLIVQEDDMADDPFNDLDELFSRYIEPMNDLVSVMLKHRNFMHGSEAEVTAMMFAKRAEAPQRIPYYFRFEANKPGVFTLTWLSLNIKSENPVRNMRVEVRPNGLRVQKDIFARPSDLIVWFKESQQTMAAAQVSQAAAAKQKARAASSASAVSAANASLQLQQQQMQAQHSQVPTVVTAPSYGPNGEPLRKSRWGDK